MLLILHLRLFQIVSGNNLTSSSIAETVRDSSRSANPDSNPKYDFCNVYVTDRVVNIRGILYPVMFGFVSASSSVLKRFISRLDEYRLNKDDHL